MKNIIWDESLSVDVDEIDDDHRKLVDLFNMLSHAIAEGGSADYIEAVFEELVSCTIWHFKHEERLMVSYKFQDLAEHRAEHDELIASVKGLQQKFHEGERQLTDDDVEYLSDWLTGHILGRDMRLGFYLMDVMK